MLQATSPVADDDVRSELQRVALRRRLASAEHEQATTEMRVTVLKAQAAGVSMTEIADLVGLSRQWLYKLLEQGE